MIKLFSFLLLIAVPATFLGAQAATFQGTVVNVQQAAVAGARVYIKSDAGVVAQVQSDRKGSFRIPLAPGRYTVEVAAEGFAPIVRTLNLQPRLAAQSFSLQPAGTSAAIGAIADDDQQMEDYLMDLAVPGRSSAANDLIFDLLLAVPRTDDSGVTMNGTVLDDQQSAVIGAEVVVKSGTRTVAMAQTGINGTFNVPLQPGPYTVEVRVAGFDKAVQTVDLHADVPPLSFLMKAP